MKLFAAPTRFPCGGWKKAISLSARVLRVEVKAQYVTKPAEDGLCGSTLLEDIYRAPYHLPLISQGFDKMRWQDAARQAQGQVHAAITSEWKLPKPQAEYLMQDIGSVPRSCGILTEEQLTITEQFSHKTRKETGRGRNLVCTGGRGLLCASCNSTPTGTF